MRLRLLDGLLLLLRRGPLGGLEAVEGLGEVVVEPVPLEPPLPLVATSNGTSNGAPAGIVQVLQVLGRVLGKLPGVVLDLVPGNREEQRVSQEQLGQP